jgi:hypothetical protein
LLPCARPRYDWLKLEDVRASLFIAAVRRRVRETRKLGEKVSAWYKFFQASKASGYPSEAGGLS